MHLGLLSWCSKRKLTLPRGSWVEEDVSHEGCKVMPKVLNIRDCGYVIPEGAVYIGRAVPRYQLKASIWGNRFRVVKQSNPSANYEAHFDAVRKYEDWLLHDESSPLGSIGSLKGKDVCCWCAPLPCHGAVLVRLANAV